MTNRLTNQDNLINITVFIGDAKKPLIMTTDRIPSVGDYLDIDEEGSYRVVRIEHVVQADNNAGNHVLRKTRVICERFELPVV